MIKNRENNYSCMTRHIESMIAAGNYRTGDRLPPLREFCQLFGLNLDTARRGIWHLRDKGLLECRRGSGVFVKTRRNEKQGGYRIGVLSYTTDLTRTYCAHVLLGMQQAALQAGVLLEVRTLNLLPAHPGESISGSTAGCDATILLGNYDNHTEPLRFLHPAVGVEMHKMYDGALSVITLDPVNAAELAVRYFRERGVEKVCLLNHSTPLTNFRSRMFAACWQEDGGELERHDFPESSKKGLVLQKDRKTGYLFTGGELFQQFSRRHTETTGRLLSEERTILSIDGKARILPGFDPVDAIGTDWPNAGKVALEEALRRLRNPGAAAERIYLDVKLELQSPEPSVRLASQGEKRGNSVSSP